jgi:lactoylglutathione lyase
LKKAIIMKLNHILVLTVDLAAMEHFWTQLIGLQKGERPPFPFKGLWLYSEDKPLVHIAEQHPAAFGNGSIAHVAFEGADYKALLTRLNQYHHPYTEKEVPLSGDRQVFIAGPDGLTVEMMFPLNAREMSNTDIQHLDYQSNDKLEFLGGKTL